MREDIYTQVTPKRALTNTLNAALVSLTVNGDAVDTQGEVGGAFHMNVDAITGGNLTFQVQAGDLANLSDMANVTDTNIVQGPIGTNITASGVQKFGYLGIKRYSRMTITGSAGLTGAVVNGLYASMGASRGGF